ncbi:hypothetical protein [Neobacillus sp. NPDC093127]|uniref:hypothetical protein n=1 Tax=Neobacillus sp. NPDC093127 TaxID=3364296 RepID=UPI0037F33AD2
MDKNPKGFVKKHISVTGGDIKINSAPTFFHFQRYDLINLNVNHFYDRNRAIMIFGSIENWLEWRKEEIEIIKKQREKKIKRREYEGERAYKIPTFSSYKEIMPTYVIGEDGIARQREE